MELVFVWCSPPKSKRHLFLGFLLEIRVVHKLWIQLFLLDEAEVNHSIERNNLIHVVYTNLKVLEFVKVIRLHIPPLLPEGHILLELLG